MKTVFTAALMLASLNSFAHIPEVVCKGQLEGEEVKVLAYVNEENYCPGKSLDSNSAIVVKSTTDQAEDELILTKLETLETSAGTKVTHTRTGKDSSVSLSYVLSSVPSTGKAVLTIKSSNENEKTELSAELECDFVHYYVDCGDVIRSRK
jgi:hypothetical protein